jgi:hypothetical protein
MTTVFVARSANLGKWASDVGLSKHVYKIGVTEGDPKAVLSEAWAGESDWTIVAAREAEAADEATIVERLSRTLKHIDPVFYPKLRGTGGVFKVTPAQVENHIIVSRALEGDETSADLKLKPTDFGAYLIHSALRQGLIGSN